MRPPLSFVFFLSFVSGSFAFLSAFRRTFVVHHLRNQILGRTGHLNLKSTNDIDTYVSVVTDEELGDLLEEMIYSGDFEGFIRRKSTKILNDDFLSYVNERVDVADDDDEMQTLQSISDLVSTKIKLSDGIENVELVFEERLSKILYTAPNRRRQYIEGSISDMSEGFISHIKKQLSSDKDVDNKVVFASILQLISEIKGNDDILHSDEAALLNRADSTLGEQFSKSSSGLVIGDSDVGDAAKSRVAVADRNEQVGRNMCCMFLSTCLKSILLRRSSLA